jgi:GT2 family glycosyltransferase
VTSQPPIAEAGGAPTPMQANEAAARGGTWCCELELSGDRVVRSVLPLGTHERARVLVRLHGDPLGYVEVPVRKTGLDVPTVTRTAYARFHAALTEHLGSEGLDAGGREVDDPLPTAQASCPNRVRPHEHVSVVVCTRDRSAVLGDCLNHLRALTYPHLEVVVVDNAPTDDSTRRVVEAVMAVDSRFRYAVEPRPGLSRARNLGLSLARGAVVAYTDDDVAVDPDWVQGLVRGFRRRSDVGCVTGLVCPASISTPAEEYFDARASSWSGRCTPQLFDLAGASASNALYPYSAGIFGTGANLAFDRDVLTELGGFDEALGAGSLTRGGEDLDVFVRILRAGRAIASEPAAVVWHHHRADRSALLRQMFGYGTGMSAYLAKCLREPATRGDVLRRIPLGVRLIAGIRGGTRERLDHGTSAPRGALASELLGLAVGPVLYLRGRRAIRRSASRKPRVSTWPASD